jgi:hypothetical protein
VGSDFAAHSKPDTGGYNRDTLRWGGVECGDAGADNAAAYLIDDCGR